MHDQIKSELKDALKAKDEVRLSTIRNMLTAFTNELVATKRKPDEKLPDEEVVGVIRRLAKQRKESIEQFRSGNRPDLALKEEAELKVLEAYLPQMMSRDEIKKIAETKKAEMGVTDKSKMGILMGAVMKELKGRADGGDVKAVVEEIL
jgi:hypothetical protein